MSLDLEQLKKIADPTVLALIARVEELGGMLQDQASKSSMEAQNYSEKAVKAERERCKVLLVTCYPDLEMEDLSRILNPAEANKILGEQE